MTKHLTLFLLLQVDSFTCSVAFLEVTCEALTLLGAEMVGERGEADAQNGAEGQSKEIQDWIDSMSPILAKSVAHEPRIKQEQLIEAREFVLRETN